jgi:hypothetical protein
VNSPVFAGAGVARLTKELVVEIYNEMKVWTVRKVNFVDICSLRPGECRHSIRDAMRRCRNIHAAVDRGDVDGPETIPTC